MPILALVQQRMRGWRIREQTCVYGGRIDLIVFDVLYHVLQNKWIRLTIATKLIPIVVFTWCFSILHLPYSGYSKHVYFTYMPGVCCACIVLLLLLLLHALRKGSACKKNRVIGCLWLCERVPKCFEQRAYEMQHGMVKIMLLLQDFGFSYVWEAGNVLACSNAQRGRNKWPIEQQQLELSSINWLVSNSAWSYATRVKVVSYFQLIWYCIWCNNSPSRTWWVTLTATLHCVHMA